MGRTVRAYVGLGSNVGHPRVTLTRAVAELAGLPGARLRGVSALYRTRPVGVADQADFLNAVVALDVPAGSDPASGALDLLRQLKGLEAAFGRTPGRRWGPRVLDLDLLLFGRARIRVERPADLAATDARAAADVPAATDQTAAGHPRLAPAGSAPRLLQVPHRDAADRLFVLAPLADLAPGLVPPGWSTTVGSARRRREAEEGADAVHRLAEWDSRAARWR